MINVNLLITMKTKFLFLVVVIAFSTTSCKKSYICECKTDGSYSVLGPNPVPSVHIDGRSSITYSEKLSKSQAVWACAHQKKTIETILRDDLSRKYQAKYLLDGTRVECDIK